MKKKRNPEHYAVIELYNIHGYRRDVTFEYTRPKPGYPYNVRPVVTSHKDCSNIKSVIT